MSKTSEILKFPQLTTQTSENSPNGQIATNDRYLATVSSPNSDNWTHIGLAKDALASVKKSKNRGELKQAISQYPAVEMLMDTYDKEIDGLKAKVNNLIEENKVLTKRDEDTREENRGLGIEIEDLKFKCQKLTDKCSELEEKLKTQTETSLVTAANAERDEALKLVAEFEAWADNAKKHYDAKCEECEKLLKEIESLNKENDYWQEYVDNNKIVTACFKKDKELRELKGQVYALKKELSNFRKGGKPIPAEDIAEIRRLRQEGRSISYICKVTERARDTVIKYSGK